MVKVKNVQEQNTREMLCQDLVWFNQSRREEITYKEYTNTQLTLQFFKSKKFRLYFYIRMMRRFYLNQHRLISLFLNNRILKIYGAEISPRARIGGGLQLGHPQGVIIGGDTIIGNYVQIGQHCTLGANLGKKGSDGRTFPIIGDNTRIFAGAVVVGPITVGSDTIVGPNSVVVRDVLSDCVVSGVPAKIIIEK